jgi:hypothetical protein
MATYRFPVASYRSGVMYPAGSIVDRELHECMTGAIPVDGKGEEIGEPVTKAMIAEAAAEARKAVKKPLPSTGYGKPSSKPGGKSETSVI